MILMIYVKPVPILIIFLVLMMISLYKVKVKINGVVLLAISSLDNHKKVRITLNIKVQKAKDQIIANTNN